MALATLSASASLAAPSMRNSTTWDTPSPSATIWRASEVQTWVKATAKAAFSASTAAPLAPDASSSTVSLVEVSPSTEIGNNLASQRSADLGQGDGEGSVLSFDGRSACA